MEIKNKFNSRNNEVFLVKLCNKEAVLKSFSNRKSFQMELLVYSKLARKCILVPELYSYDENKMELVLSYLEGETLLSFLEKAEKEFRIEDSLEKFESLFCWLDAFHSCQIFEGKEHVLYDVNYRNFILSDGYLYGIDFENVRKGARINDYIKILAMLRWYNPVNSDFKNILITKLVDRVAQKKSLQKETLIYLMKKEESRIIDRRKKYKRFNLPKK